MSKIKVSFFFSDELFPRPINYSI